MILKFPKPKGNICFCGRSNLNSVIRVHQIEALSYQPPDRPGTGPIVPPSTNFDSVPLFR